MPDVTVSVNGLRRLKSVSSDSISVIGKRRLSADDGDRLNNYLSVLEKLLSF